MKTADTTPLPPWLQELYDFRPKRFATPDGASMSYLDEGPRSSEAVLMLHGNPTWSFYYRKLVSALAPTARCIVPDHIGMGLSEKPANYDYRLATRVRDVAALIAKLELTKVHLVVHDWGGAIGCGFAAQQPELIGKVVILNTAAFPAGRIPLRIALCKLPWFGSLLVRGLNGFAGPATWMSTHRKRLTANVRDAYLFPYDNWDNRVAVSGFVDDIPLTEDHPSMPALREAETGVRLLAKREVRIFWGGKDFCFNDTFYEEWRSRLPDARATYFPDAGHYVLEDAENEIIGETADFLGG